MRKLARRSGIAPDKTAVWQAWCETNKTDIRKRAQTLKERRKLELAPEEDELANDKRARSESASPTKRQKLMSVPLVREESEHDDESADDAAGGNGEDEDIGGTEGMEDVGGMGKTEGMREKEEALMQETTSGNGAAGSTETTTNGSTGFWGVITFGWIG